MPKPALRPRLLLPLLALVATGCAVGPLRNVRWLPGYKPRVTMKSLIAELGDLDRLASFPDPTYQGLQASSYDPNSKTPGNDAWFANDDRGKFIRTEQNGGRKEFVMMDVDGPGAITRIWSANAQGTIRFYLNGAAEPAYETKMADLLSGKNPLFPFPVGHSASRGWNIYYPFAYSRHMKVTTDSGDTLYYQINYRTYPEGTEVEDFSAAEAERLQPDLAKAIEAMTLGGKGVADLGKAPHEPLEPGEEKILASAAGGPAQVELLAIHAEAGDIAAALRGSVLKISVDGATAVVAPIGDFFGASPGINPYEALPLGVMKNGTMYSRWRMPFRKRVEVSVANKSGAPVGVAVEMKTAPIPGGGSARTLGFRAAYHAEFGMPTRPYRDWNYLEAKGRGVFVGDSLAIANPVKAWWGEGDEKIYFDGQTFPSHFGTGTEDYYGYAWCSNQLYGTPYIGQTTSSSHQSYGLISLYRFHILDPIAFTESLRFDLEVRHWGDPVYVTYDGAVFWYARPSAHVSGLDTALEDFFLPELGVDPPAGVAPGAYRCGG